jgi:hypothetical protein
MSSSGNSLGTAMPSRSPTAEGFQIMFRRPSLGLAEVAWRWSFGFAAAVLLAFSCFEYLDSLPVAPVDSLLLKSRHPTLMARAFLHIFRGSGLRLVVASLVAAVSLAAAWIVIASLGRAATLQALLQHFRTGCDPAGSSLRNPWRLRSLFGLSFIRVAVTVAAVVAYLAAFVLPSAALNADNQASGMVALISLSALFLVFLTWSILNWFLSAAAVFVVRDGRDTISALAATVDLCTTRPGPVFAAGTWFGLAHMGVFAVATSIVTFPMGFAGVLPARIVLGSMLLITLLYFAAADFLYTGRLAAYVAILEWPESPVRAASPSPVVHTQPAAAAVDPDELILSDITPI